MPKPPFSKEQYFQMLEAILNPPVPPQGSSGMSRGELDIFLQQRRRRNGRQVRPAIPPPRGAIG